MNYLAGPIMRNRIPDLNALAGAELTPAPAAQPRWQRARQMHRHLLLHTKVTCPARHPGRKCRLLLMSIFGRWSCVCAIRPKHGNTSLPLDVEEIGVLYRPALLAQAKNSLHKSQIQPRYRTGAHRTRRQS